MGYKTQFGGYTPELDLASIDWTKRWNTVAQATVQGIAYEFLNSDEDPSDASVYTFSGVISGPGKYIVGIVANNNTSTGGVQGVAVDGQVGVELLENINNGVSANRLTTALWLLNPTSFADGDINVTFNATQEGCSIIVWQMFGDLGGSYDALATAALGSAASIATSLRNVLLGISGNQGGAASDTFWSGIRERTDDLVDGTTYRSAADKLLFADESTYEIVAVLNAAADASRWTVINYQSPVTYFPSGQSIAFSKQTSGARVLWSWDTVPQLADLEVLTLIRPTLVPTTSNFGLAIRAGGSVSLEDAYRLLFSESGSGLRDRVILSKLVDGADTTLDTESLSWSTGTNYWMKLRARGTLIQGKVWAEGTTEPTDWMLEATDSSLTVSGYSGISHFGTDSTFEIGSFEVRQLYTEWPAEVPFNWTVDMSGGPQSNKIVFKPDVGPTIDRRRASSVARRYTVECPGLSQEEYRAFTTFYHTTLKEGTLPFNARDPFTGLEKLWKFGDDDPAYNESMQRPVGEDFDNGLYRVTFSVMRLD